MIYCFGDSLTYGVPFHTNIREKSNWPYHLSNFLNDNVQNLSLPGGSNWRIARQITNLELNEKDLVVISWTDSTRFEFGISDSYPIKINKRLPFNGDDIEKDNDIICKRFYNQLSKSTADKKVKEFNTIAYDELFNENWFETMFKIIFSSCVYSLKKSGCKWLMFNAWCRPYNKNNDDFEIENYILGYKNHMSSYLKKDNYWEIEDHIEVAKIIFEHYKKIYG